MNKKPMKKTLIASLALLALVFAAKVYADATAEPSIADTAAAGLSEGLNAYKAGGWLAVLNLLTVIVVSMAAGVSGQALIEHTLGAWAACPNAIKAAAPALISGIAGYFSTKWGVDPQIAILTSGLSALLMHLVNVTPPIAADAHA